MTTALGRSWLLAALLALAACGDAPEPQRELVLLVTVDTLRPDYLSLYGYDRESSPFLRELGARGLVFENAITPIARTTPALASLLTGEYPHEHGVRTLLHTLDERTPTLAEAARAAGYATLAVVSNHILTPARGLGRGFDVYDFAGDRRDAAATTRAALELADRYRDSPRVFLWVHYIDPHVPYAPDPADARELDPGYEGAYPLRFGDGLIGDSAYPRELGKSRSVYRNQLPDAVNAHVRRLYAADIRGTDRAIGELVRGLEAQRAAPWLVVFTADHGEALGEQPFYFYDHGDYVSQAELRVPLAIVLPEGDPLQQSGRSDVPASLVDVAPTIAELLELPLAEPVAGRSLVPLLRGEALAPRPLFAESGHAFSPEELRRRTHFGVEGRLRAVVDGRSKLVFTPGLPVEQAFQLYDLANDPDERRDLFAPDDPRAQRLQALLRAWLTTGNDTPATPSDADLERLRALGYVE